MDNLDIIVRGKGSDISTDFYEPINIPTEVYDAKLGIKSFSTYNNIPNVVKGQNSKLKVKVPGEVSYKVFEMETRAYELRVIADQLVEWIKVTFPTLDKIEENFKLIPNYATAKADWFFKGDYGVDFDVDASCHALLGFDKTDRFQGTGVYTGKHIVNITSVTQLIFNCNLTTSNYINGKEMPFLYNCGINVPSGYRLTRELTDIAYKSLNTSQISHIRIWIVDEHGTPINLRNEDLTVTLSLKFKQLVMPVAVQ